MASSIQILIFFPYSFSLRMDKGDFSGKELLEIQNAHPEWYSRLEKDPFVTRYVSGEAIQFQWIFQSEIKIWRKLRRLHIFFYRCSP